MPLVQLSSTVPLALLVLCVTILSYINKKPKILTLSKLQPILGTDSYCLKAYELFHEKVDGSDSLFQAATPCVNRGVYKVVLKGNLITPKH